MLAVYATARLPIVMAIALLVALDVAALAYWCRFKVPRVAIDRARSPMRSLGSALHAAGVLLIGTSLWIMLLGFLSESGIGVADWSGLAMAGFEEPAGRRAVFGLRCLAVAVSVWIVGFGLMRASGEQA